MSSRTVTKFQVRFPSTEGTLVYIPCVATKVSIQHGFGSDRGSAKSFSRKAADKVVAQLALIGVNDAELVSVEEFGGWDGGL